MSQPPTSQPPTAVAQRYVRYVVGFGVGFIVGLAPFLGTLKVPLFTPLLSLIPEASQNVALPLSGLLMGGLGIVVQWLGGERPTRKGLQRWFKLTLVILIVAFISLMIVHTFVVVTVPILGGRDSESFVVGFVRPNKPPCTEAISDAECIKHLTLDPSAIESYWGDRQVRLARLALVSSYLLATGAFVALIGLLILSQSTKRKGKSQR